MKKMSSIEGMYMRSHDSIIINMASQQIRHTWQRSLQRLMLSFMLCKKKQKQIRYHGISIV